MTIDSAAAIIAAAPADAPATDSRRLWVRHEGEFDPLDVVVRLAESGGFDESVVYEGEGQWWFAGGAVAEVAVHAGAVVGTSEGRCTRVPWVGSPARAIEAVLAGLPIEDWRLYGWVGFELGRAVAALPVGADLLGRLTVPRVEVGVDETALTVWACDIQELRRVTRIVLDGDRATAAPSWPVDVEDDDPAPFTAAVAATVGRIRAGEADKVVLSRRVAVPYAVDFPATYLRGRRANTPARSFLLDLPGLRAVGFSPETVVEVAGDRTVTVRPLAGTCPRDGDPAFDARRRGALMRDAKEVHEHELSVRAAEVELRALCEPDSVGVDEFMAVRERGNVHHIGSRLSGRLAQPYSAWDALVATTPGLAATGVPRAAAYAVIDAHEPGPRGLYGGAVIRVGRAGELDATLALRMIHTRDDTTWLQAGAGIVRDSRPPREYRETCHQLATTAPHIVPLPNGSPKLR
ncbi:salicylate synthase [Embleya sp. NPDC020630]|uniref:salicylate synthase n=1 Tax=Embleya sp. NPDC020630 TaxID=3363979 RepID=UPI0037B7BAAB